MMRKKRNPKSKLALIIFLLIIGVISFVLATAPVWVGSTINYTTSEDSVYYHNLSMNITGFNNDVEFAFDTESQISWTNSSGTYLVTPSQVPWINISNSTTGNFTITATYDNQSGFFVIPIQATNITDDEFTGTNFEFIINATNDAPAFSLENNYNKTIQTDINSSKNITLIGTDEEEHYPLVYNVSFNNCSFASWSSRTNADCSLPYNIIQESDTTSILALDNLSYNDVGEYNLTICVNDEVNLSSLPLHYVPDYVENKSYCLNTTLYLYSSLSINATDCDGRNWTQGDDLNCTINITTIGLSDSINISSLSYFTNDINSDYHNQSWFYANSTQVAVDGIVSVDVSILSLGKEEVGNWMINFTVDDGSLTETPRPLIEQIFIFVNYTESNVSLSTISNYTGANALYENEVFQITATDDDLLIWDDSVKKELFTFSSNQSWVTINCPNQNQDSNNNYRNATITINHSYVLNNVSLGEGNYSVNISVVDNASNLDWKVFNVEILNDTAPEFNGDYSGLIILNLTEDSNFVNNLTLNFSDEENDTITFYYEDLSSDFCSLNSTNFPLNGFINFTPVDCDVGFHNVSIIASDDKKNSTYVFGFNVSNVVDAPEISSLLDRDLTEDIYYNDISFSVDDYDFLIPVGQKEYYNESLSVILTFVNMSDDEVVSSLFNFSENGLVSYTQNFIANFTPDEENVGEYNVTVNVTDSSGNSTIDYFTLNITRVNDAPNLTYIPNQETTSRRVFYLDVNATDEEDDLESLPLNYTLYNLTVGGDFLTINSTTGIINHTMNESLAGIYQYNITVNDSEGGIDWQVFNLTVYGTPNITAPEVGHVFNFTEDVLSSGNEFEVDYMINDTNLTYAFYLDKIIFSDSVNYSYSNISLRDSETYSWNSSSNFSWNFTPDYSDETYGMLKNLTLIVYNTEYPELNDTLNYKVNISHTNENVSFSGYVSDKGPVSIGTGIEINLSEYFSDADYSDEYYNQVVNFSIVTSDGYTTYVQSGSSPIIGWTVNLSSVTDTIEVISIVADEYVNGAWFGNASTNEFEVEFIPPVEVEVETPSGSSGGGSTVRLKHFSLKLVMPQDVILSNENYIEIPFSLQNNGVVDLTGINLNSDVRFNNAFSDDIKVTLQNTYVPLLKVGQTENYTLKINANTQRSGKYKVTIFANVTSPKFSDWGEFFINLKKTNESEAEQMLIFTEKLVADNPECIELTELLNRAREAYDTGDITSSIKLTEEVTIACENSILANEQIRYSAKNFVENNFYTITFIFLGLLIMGLAFYIYKRVRFNKYKGDYY